MIRPTYTFLSVADALKRDWRGWHLSRKMDGVFNVQKIGSLEVCGELMRDGTFWPFDCAAPGDWQSRFNTLNSAQWPQPWHPIPACDGADAGQLLQSCVHLARLDNTPDVCVAKPICAGFGESLVKIKLVETYDAEVTDADGDSNSVAISYQGTNAGRVSVRGAARDNLRVGQIIEIRGTLLPSGKFREPRFLRVRMDK